MIREPLYRGHRCTRSHSEIPKITRIFETLHVNTTQPLCQGSRLRRICMFVPHLKQEISNVGVCREGLPRTVHGCNNHWMELPTCSILTGCCIELPCTNILSSFLLGAMARGRNIQSLNELESIPPRDRDLAACLCRFLRAKCS